MVYVDFLNKSDENLSYLLSLQNPNFGSQPIGLYYMQQEVICLIAIDSVVSIL